MPSIRSIRRRHRGRVLIPALMLPSGITSPIVAKSDEKTYAEIRLDIEEFIGYAQSTV